jgi:hypothetical protein
MSRIDEIAGRKQRLIADSDARRNEIARVYYQYQARTLLARQVTGFLRNPLVLAGLGLLALKMPWRRTFRFGGWVWRVWRLFRTVRRFAG